MRSVAQQVVFDTSSAAMAENSHGLKPTLVTLLLYHYLIPQSPTFQAAVGLDGAEAVPDVYFPRLNPFDLIQKKASPTTLITLHSAVLKVSKLKVLRQPLALVWGIRVPERHFSVTVLWNAFVLFLTHSHIACRLLICCFIIPFDNSI